MKNFAVSSSNPWQEIPKWIAIVFLLVSFLGFLDATYLTAKYYLGEPVTCSLLAGCEKVTTSAYAVWGGLPIALFGSFYYLAIFVLVLFYLDTGRKAAFTAAAWLTLPGFLISLGLLYLQLFVILALCLYCIFSLATSSVLFILALTYMRKTLFYRPV